MIIGRFLLVFLAVVGLEALEFDIEENPDPFVLETTLLPAIKGVVAFNPSLFKVGDHYLSVFRQYNPNRSDPVGFAYIWYDQDFIPVTRARILRIPSGRNGDNKKQDLRMIMVGGKLWGVYSVQVMELRKRLRRFALCSFRLRGFDLYADPEQIILSLPPIAFQDIEKNWTPFVWQDKLLLSYTISPQVVVDPHAKEVFSISEEEFPWEWGEIRGGTPAIRLDEGHYLSIFHSCSKMKSFYSPDKEVRHYFMGAYVFESEPPFRVTAISKKPIIAKGFYSGKHYVRTWTPLRCVFPVGIVDEGDTILISYGRDDNEMWIMRVDKAGLINSLAQ